MSCSGLLYEGGDAPSVVGWPGKMSDCEYRNLKGHEHFLEILQGVSLYDHTYNVLKAALDIADEELRQRHDFLLPAIITAALGHDMGKIESLWGSSPVPETYPRIRWRGQAGRDARVPWKQGLH